MSFKGQVNAVELYGQTVVNLLGNKGRGDSIDGWTTLQLSTTIKNNTNYFTLDLNEGVAEFVPVQAEVGDKLYLALDFFAEGENTRELILRFYNTNTSTSVSSSLVISSSITTLTRQSTITTLTGVADSLNIVRGGNSTTSTPCYFKHILVINLTQMFGAGNEPTLEECDRMFHYIDGTKSTLCISGNSPLRVISF